MMVVITAFLSYVTYKLYVVFIEIKNASIRNKSIFIEEFKKKGYLNHSYTEKNYSSIKQWMESKYPQMDYIKSQDLQYTSMLFRNSKNSKEYKQALKSKEDISKIYKEIEFGVLRECFKEIIKIEKFMDENYKLKEEAFNENSKLFKAMSNDAFFVKKIARSTVHLCISLFVSIISIILTLIPYIKINFI